MSALTGTGQLVRLAVRRDRILLPAWIATFVVMVTFSASATTGSRVPADRGVRRAVRASPGGDRSLAVRPRAEDPLPCVQVMPLLGLLTAATLLIGAGVVGFRRRDVG